MTSHIEVMEKYLDYCYDRGEQYNIEADERDMWHDRLQEIDKALHKVNPTLPAEKQLKKRIAAAESKIFQSKPIAYPQALRRAMTPNLVQKVLKQCSAYRGVTDSQQMIVASTICSSYCKVFAILHKFNEVNSIAEFIKCGIDDSNLPLQGKYMEEAYGVYLKNNSFVSVEGWEESDWHNFFHWQWTFLTPFFARPKGKVLHYPLKSHDILPIIDREDYESDENDGQEDEGSLGTRKPIKIKRRPDAYGGHSTVSKIKLDPLSCDFGEFRVRKLNASPLYCWLTTIVSTSKRLVRIKAFDRTHYLEGLPCRSIRLETV